MSSLHSEVKSQLIIECRGQGQRTGAQRYRVFDLSFVDLGMQGSHVLVVERQLPTHQDVKDDSKTPYVHLRAYVWLRVQDFWGSKV